MRTTYLTRVFVCSERTHPRLKFALVKFIRQMAVVASLYTRQRFPWRCFHSTGIIASVVQMYNDQWSMMLMLMLMTDFSDCQSRSNQQTVDDIVLISWDGWLGVLVLTMIWITNFVNCHIYSLECSVIDLFVHIHHGRYNTFLTIQLVCYKFEKKSISTALKE